jgi:hypothetical protein
MTTAVATPAVEENSPGIGPGTEFKPLPKPTRTLYSFTVQGVKVHMVHADGEAHPYRAYQSKTNKLLSSGKSRWNVGSGATKRIKKGIAKRKKANKLAMVAAAAGQLVLL